MRSCLGGVLIGKDRGRFSVPLCAAAIVAAAVMLLALPNATVLAAYILLGIALCATAALIAIVLDHRAVLRNAQLTATGGMILVCLTLSFAGVYYRESQTHQHAFSSKLDRLSAVYFAIGTLSTNGTQGVQPVSGAARADSIVQESADTLILATFFGTLVWRLGYRAASRSEQRRRPRNQADPFCLPEGDARGLRSAGPDTTGAHNRHPAASTPIFTIAQPPTAPHTRFRGTSSSSSTTTHNQRSTT